MDTLTVPKCLVVKIGSALLVDENGLRRDWLNSLAQDVAEAKARGSAVILVSSGSIALGRVALDLPQGPLSLEQAQAAAAVGQIRLARAYEEALAPFGIKTAQVLLTLEDSADRRRYLNSRATLAQLLALDVVPIVNENDTVATDEIRFGDNDRLAAQIAVTVAADRLVLLSDVDGFYSADPRSDETATRYDVINQITPDIEAMAGDAGTGLSKGGMKTKIMAARTAVHSGCDLVITKGSGNHPLAALNAGAPATWFKAQVDPQTARKRWISAMKPRGEFVIDAGAEAALLRGKSLLPAGVTRVSGRFNRGDAIAILGPGGQTLGLGITRYNSQDAHAIAGAQSSEIEAILGYPGRAALVHRDDMAL